MVCKKVLKPIIIVIASLILLPLVLLAGVLTALTIPSVQQKAAAMKTLYAEALFEGEPEGNKRQALGVTEIAGYEITPSVADANRVLHLGRTYP